MCVCVCVCVCVSVSVLACVCEYVGGRVCVSVCLSGWLAGCLVVCLSVSMYKERVLWVGEWPGVGVSGRGKCGCVRVTTFTNIV